MENISVHQRKQWTTDLSVHAIHPTIDDTSDVDPFGNSKIPSSDEERLVEYYDSIGSKYKNKTERKLNNCNSNSQKENKKMFLYLLSKNFIDVSIINIIVPNDKHNKKGTVVNSHLTINSQHLNKW